MMLSSIFLSSDSISTSNFLPPKQRVMFRIGVQLRADRFSGRVFEAAIRRLRQPYSFSYRQISFNGSSDELVKAVARKRFDIGVGDIVITPRQHYPVEFSYPYLEPGFVMVIKDKHNQLNAWWWLLSPFTPALWITIVVLSVLMKAAILLLEGRDQNAASLLQDLYYAHRRPLRINLASLLKVFWLFGIFVLSSVYISRVTAIFTTSQQKPSDFDSLRWRNAVIGCDGESQTLAYIVNVLGFRRRNIRTVNSIHDYAESLSSEKIEAAFMLTSQSKVFFAKHCTGYTEITPTYGYNLSAFAFVFAKGSPLASSMSAAILEMEERGKLQQMEEASFPSCKRKQFADARIQPIGLTSFRLYFILCGSTLGTAFLVILYEHVDALLSYIWV